jgi:VanZ family protein
MIFILSSQSLDFIGQGPFPQWDKFAHATEYALFCFLLLRALRKAFPRAVSPAIAVSAVLIAVAYGASDEFHQSFVPHRDSEVFDVLADGGGAILVSWVWVLWNKRKPDTP